MRAFLGTVLSLIAAGVLLIAYALLATRAPMVSSVSSVAPITDASDQLARPIYAAVCSAYGAPGFIDRPARRDFFDEENATNGFRPVSRYATPRRPLATRVAVGRGRDWKRTAMVIGGSTAAAAGLGAIFGGKKGALIGAALGGGASTIYEVRRR